MSSQAASPHERPSVAIVTFTDDRDVGLYSPEVEERLRRKQGELRVFLEANGVRAVDPLGDFRKKGALPYGVRNRADVGKVLSLLSRERVDGLIIGSWNWSPPMLVMDFVRKLDRPVMYYTENDPMAGSLSQLTATCASLLEWGVSRHALLHDRAFGNRDALLVWARAAGAVSRMREGALLLWGGSYAVKMEHLQDDIPRLKSFMIRDVLQEDQLVLVNRAEKLRRDRPERIAKLLGWLTVNGLRISYDEKMVTEEAVSKQAALLIAARDRLAELGGLGGLGGLGSLGDENVLGVSVKCQPEIYFEYGVNACTIPALLPFAASEEGEARVYPAVCEGDIKGLLTSVLLHSLNPAVPPAFGDLVSVGDDHVEFANCGAGSLYWAANSPDPGEALKNTEAVSNIHGVSGAAFSYYGRAMPAVTVARLTRVRGEYFMQLGAGRALDAREFLGRMLGDRLKGHLGGTWGKVVVDLGVRGENFVKSIGANHLSATAGDFSREIETVCRLWGVPVVRIDSDEEMERFYREVRLDAGGRR